MNSFLFIITIFCVSICHAADRSATYFEADGNTSISLELFHIHPFLAEYDRDLVVLLKGRAPIRHRLFPDTGGYTATNLYKCGDSQYLIKGYFDSWIVNIHDPSIKEGECDGKELKYIGGFHGAGSKPWVFSPASEREEQPLKPYRG